MRRQTNGEIAYDRAPHWAEWSAPRNRMMRDIPAILMIQVPGEQSWDVASKAETEAIANPNSPLGHLLRKHCGLLPLPYNSNN